VTQYVKRRRATGAQARMQQIPKQRPKRNVEVPEDDDEFTYDELRNMLFGAMGCIVLLFLTVVTLILILVFH